MVGEPIDDKDRGGCMKIFGIVSFLVFFVASVPLFAQQSGTSSTATSSINTEFGGSYGGVENVSAQAVGTFVGGGRPTTGFVGMTEIYGTGSNRSSGSSRTSTAARTTTARPVTTTAQRRATTPTSRAAQTGGVNNQTIRSATSIDFDAMIPSPQIPPTTVATHLNSRIPGIQGSQITFRSSPMGTTAVLTGTAASERDRKVAQQFLLMEPGISRVENLLELR